jgi:anion-transporting  ArsA/GET3 family ATPase
MSVESILDRRLVIISGKGGVGKTTVAAAVAAVAARHDLRVLVAEVEGNNSLSSLYGTEPLTPTPAPLGNNLWGMNISPEEALEEYFDVQLHMKRIARPLVGTQLVYYVTHAAPGLRDILMLGKVWYAATRKKEFDLIVLDTPASGHAVSMLKSPEGFLHAVPIGPLAGHSRQVVEWLQDPEQVSIHLVSTAEEMPVNETLETVALLESKLGMDVTNIHVNMLYPPMAADPKLAAALEKLGGPEALAEASPKGRLDKKAAQTLFECGDFYRARRAVQTEHRTRLVEALKKTAKAVELPFLFRESFGADEIEVLADVIEEQLKT